MKHIGHLEQRPQHGRCRGRYDPGEVSGAKAGPHQTINDLALGRIRLRKSPPLADAQLDEPHPHYDREQPNEPCHRCRYETALYNIHV